MKYDVWWSGHVSLARTAGRTLILAGLLAVGGCADGETLGHSSGDAGGPVTGTGGSGGGAGGAGGLGSGGMGGSGGGDLGPIVPCDVEVEFTPAAPVANPRVAGEWHGFALPSATEMSGPSVSGSYTATLSLEPGLHAYKIVYDDVGSGQETWVFNPDEARRKYVDGTDNSAVKVRDCRRPWLEVEDRSVERPSAGQGTFTATLAYVDAADQTGPDATGYEAELWFEGQSRTLTAAELAVDADGTAHVDVSGLDDGKYRVVLRARTQSGRWAEPHRLIFWVEQEAFSWKDALIYMVVTDRFRDGDAGNNPGATPGADPRGDWYGGDLEGLRLAIADGTLDQLGIRAIWLTPFQTNPDEAYLASDGVHLVTGYHGYWPTKAREVDARLGGEVALRAVIEEAHRHGIRILMDYVVNHVHEDHEYVSAHPEWFRTGCVCGTPGCDWTANALECTFTSYLPDINHSVPEANAKFVEDAVWWLDEFDLDGLRVDAVKHVEEVATRNLAAEVREGFEDGGTRYFLMGETAMGWNDCPDPCNDENYGTISKYVGPHGLDGQFDFVLYHGVSYRTFAYGDQGMLHADYWTQHGLTKWPEGAIMTPYIGSHDTSRFASIADYRGQDAAHDRSIPGNQWDNTAVAPSDGEPYRRTRIAMAWLLGLPGAPLMYYGDEYGQWGGADPNNRLMWRDDGDLSADELATLSFVRQLGAARRDHEPLRRGDYVSLGATEDTLVFGRKIAAGDAAVVALTRSFGAEGMTVEVQGSLGLLPGTTLTDALGGPSATVAGDGTLSVTVPASGALVLVP